MLESSHGSQQADAPPPPPIVWMMIWPDSETTLYLLVRLNNYWFKLDKPFVSTFVKRWHLETYTFHILFEKCTIMLQDVAYQLAWAIDGEAISGYLAYFPQFTSDGKPIWEWFEELLSKLSSSRCIK
ncbi:hypothetical protein Ahy_A10g048637 [Arachis hypogaea]|uniref:Aminotransferase-like plant mobile domain-containing protein n=1 Tax=Arachis hypogaea TaxID=3818 RepID=A0A445B5P5_ARAHY|nr:hypothetical protein Ahy_A10g048637 [Arachis hypogaea]